MTPRILELLRGHWESSQHPEKVLLWAVATLCFAGFFRSGELLSTPTTQHCLSWGDVSLDSQSRPTVVCVRQFGSRSVIRVRGRGQCVCGSLGLGAVPCRGSGGLYGP